MALWLTWWRLDEEDRKKVEEYCKKKVEECRKKVASARHLLLSEFFEATTGMVILPGLRDLQGGVLEETSMLWWFQWYWYGPAPSEGEEIYGAIKQLRYEVLEYTMRCKKSWAEEYRLAKKLEPVLDRASKFLSAGKTASHGHAQITKGRNTRVVSDKPEDSLDALSDGMIQFSEKTSPKRSADIMNVVYPLYVSNFIYCSIHCPLVHLALSCCMMKCATVPKSIVGLYECGHISEKPKIQSANTGPACKDVHSLTEAEQENHCEKIMAYKFPMVHPWHDVLWTSAIDSFKYEDCTSSVRREGSYVQFSVETKVENTLLVSHKPDDSLDAISDGMVAEKTWLDGIDYYIKKIPYQGPVQQASRILQNGMDTVYPASHKDRTSSIGWELSYVQFSIETSPKGGVYIKIGSYKKHVPKYGSVHSPLVQMMLFADSLYGATLACLKSMVPKSIVNIYESGLISEKLIPQSTNPNVDDLTDAEPENTGAPDSVHRRMCRNIEEVVKTAATWLIDTGAVHHATGKLSLMSDVTTEADDDLFMTARDGVRMRIHAHGSVITDTVVLPDVWYIPGLTKNVVSASQLNQLGYSIGFTRGTCFIRSATDGTLIGKGHVSDDGLFEMDFLKVS